MKQYIIAGATFIADGTTDFKEWEKMMVCEFGNCIKPCLSKVWEQAKVHNLIMEEPKMLSDLGELLGFHLEASARAATKYQTMFLDDLRSSSGDVLAEWAENNMPDIVAELERNERRVAGWIEKLDALADAILKLEEEATNE